MATKKTERAPIYAIKRRGYFEPSAAMDAEEFDRFPNGLEVEIVIKSKRSLPALRYYWAVLGATVKATGRWPSKDNLSDELKMACGVTEVRRKMTGEYYLAPDSVAFDRMQEPDFKDYMTRAFATLAEHIGCDPVSLLPERRRDAA